MKILFFILIPFCSFGQIKIGDITVSNDVAKEYFLDCKQKPDTVWRTHFFYMESDMNEEIYWAKNEGQSLYKVKSKREIAYDIKLKEEIGQRRIRDSIATIGFTQQQRDSYFINQFNSSTTTSQIIYHGQIDSNHFPEGYAIPRTPSASDFATWFSKNYPSKQ